MTKATKYKTVNEAKTEANEATGKATNVTRHLFSALTTSSRKAFSGVVEFDKALFGMAKESVAGHGKAIMKAKSINDVVDLQASYAHSAIETTAANSRELLDMARIKTEEAYAPIKEVIAEFQSEKKAA